MPQATGPVSDVALQILEQVEGGDLVVNLGKESRPKDVGQRKGGRNLNPVEGLEAALKLSEVSQDVSLSWTTAHRTCLHS